MGGHELENVEYEITGKVHLDRAGGTIPFSHGGSGQRPEGAEVSDQ